MSSEFTNLGLEKIGNGEQGGSWGTTSSRNFDQLDAAISQQDDISVVTTEVTVTTFDGAISSGRKAILNFVTTALPDLTENATITIAPNDLEKLYFIRNNTGGDRAIVIEQGSGGSVTVPNGTSAIVHCDGGGDTASVTNISTELTTSNADAGTQIWLGVSDFVFASTNNPAENLSYVLGSPDYKIYNTLTYAASGDYAQVDFVLPDDWSGSTFTVKPYFIFDGVDLVNDIVFNCRASAYSDGDPLDPSASCAGSAWGAAVTSTKATAGLAADTVYKGGITAAITPCSPASGGDALSIQVYRGDSNTDNVDLIGILVTYT